MSNLVLACVKLTVDMVRRKFSGIPSLEAKAMITLDGDKLILEGEKLLGDTESKPYKEDQLLTSSYG